MEENKNSMNKFLPISLVLILVVVAGIYFFWSSSRSDSNIAMDKTIMENTSNENMIKEDKIMMEDGTMIDDSKKMVDDKLMESEKGMYVPYSQDKIALAKDGKVVLFFRASWCPSCRSLDSNIRSNLSSIPKGVVILDVDYDKYSDLKSKYSVTYQHTLVQVNQSGNMISKWSGSSTLSDLLSKIK